MSQPPPARACETGAGHSGAQVFSEAGPVISARSGGIGLYNVGEYLRITGDDHPEINRNLTEENVSQPPPLHPLSPSVSHV